uniref:Programmed cell death protein 5 n=1 Tax=Panagrolaimus sp. JU765 TaxID=591449 RepID=A0AC34QGW9_9BILA
MEGIQNQKTQAGSGPSAEEKAKAAEEQEKMKTNILTQILQQDAMARLSTLRAAKPERAQQVEAMLINMARSGRIGGKLNDEQFRGLLNQVTDAQPKKTPTVTTSEPGNGCSTKENSNCHVRSSTSSTRFRRRMLRLKHCLKTACYFLKSLYHSFSKN